MSLQALATQNVVTLKGSAQMVAEYFNHAVSSILYQRGIYPPESFHGKKEYGLTIMVSIDEGIKSYIKQITDQLEAWLAKGQLERLVLDIARAYPPHEVVERWTFAVETDKEVVAGRKEVQKSEKDIKQEIQAIIRQITASVTYLPLINDPCTFDLKMVVPTTANAPSEWEDCNLSSINKAQDMKLRSFSTKVHAVDTMVTYQMEDDEDDPR